MSTVKYLANSIFLLGFGIASLFGIAEVAIWIEASNTFWIGLVFVIVALLYAPLVQLFFPIDIETQPWYVKGGIIASSIARLLVSIMLYVFGMKLMGFSNGDALVDAGLVYMALQGVAPWDAFWDFLGVYNPPKVASLLAGTVVGIYAFAASTVIWYGVIGHIELQGAQDLFFGFLLFGFLYSAANFHTILDDANNWSVKKQRAGIVAGYALATLFFFIGTF